MTLSIIRRGSFEFYSPKLEQATVGQELKIDGLEDIFCFRGRESVVVMVSAFFGRAFASLLFLTSPPRMSMTTPLL